MSFGFASGKRAVMRGPMVSSIVTQLIIQTQWDDLDYLVVDMPPGTGDIQITLGQEIAFDGAVIVTTPQRLSFVDVVKGIEMFDDLKVPTIAVIENMVGNKHKCFIIKYQPYIVKIYLGILHMHKLQS
jgi:Mrp family chromosome partitioning ATPase